ncbi:MAG: ribokinase [Armatimonadetes bacterium]|nr:ribokinase [Armatimonadota bacterium]
MDSRCWIVGSAVLDNVLAVDRLPKAGESVLARSFDQFLGGKGVNQAVACARHGAATEIFACLGHDPAGDRFAGLFEAEGLGMEGVLRADGLPTGQAAIALTPNGMNQIIVYPGSNMALPALAIENAPIAPNDYVLCQLEVPDEVVLAASARGRFVFNPAPYRAFPKEVLPRCFALTPNESEAESITGHSPSTEEGLQRCADSLLESGVANVVVTLGERGVFFKNASVSRHFQAPAVDAVDTTAAGDVFNGAMIARLSLGDDIESAVAYAVDAASLSVTRAGAVPSIPDSQQTAAFIQAKNQKMEEQI